MPAAFSIRLAALITPGPSPGGHLFQAADFSAGLVRSGLDAGA